MRLFGLLKNNSGVLTVINSIINTFNKLLEKLKSKKESSGISVSVSNNQSSNIKIEQKTSINHNKIDVVDNSHSDVDINI